MVLLLKNVIIRAQSYLVSRRCHGQSSRLKNNSWCPKLSAPTQACLYSIYIILNAVLSALLGRVIDKDFTAHNNIHNALVSVAG